MPTYTGTSEMENLAGTHAADLIQGLGGNDNLVGVEGGDTLTGGDGDDSIDGGKSVDLLEGGPGADRFIMSVRPLDMAGGEPHSDQISDFTPGVDKIIIFATRETTYTELPAGVLSAGMLRYTTNANTDMDRGADADDFFIYNQDSGTLYFDRGANDFARGIAIANLSGNPALGASDIEVILLNKVDSPTSSGVYQGTASHDDIGGGLGNDTFSASPANDWIFGGGGRDFVVYPGARESYELRRASTSTSQYLVQDREPAVQGDLGIDTLNSVERLRFDGISVALDFGANGSPGGADYVARILGAVFGAAAVADPRVVGIGLYHFDTRNYLFGELAQLALDARLGPAPTNREVVELLYTNVTSSAPSEGAVQYYTSLIDNGTYTQGSLAAMAANRPENLARIDLVGLADNGLNFFEHSPG